jgi:hypothetical protein
MAQSQQGYAKFPKTEPTGILHNIRGSQYALSITKKSQKDDPPLEKVATCLGCVPDFSDDGGGALWNTATVVTGELVTEKEKAGGSMFGGRFAPYCGYHNAAKFFYHVTVWLAAIVFAWFVGLSTALAPDELGAGWLRPKEWVCHADAVTANCPAKAGQAQCGDGSGSGGVCDAWTTQYTEDSYKGSYTYMPSSLTKNIAGIWPGCITLGFLLFIIPSGCYDKERFTQNGWWQMLALTALNYGMICSLYLLSEAALKTDNDEQFALYVVSTLLTGLAVLTYYSFSSDLGFAKLPEGFWSSLVTGSQLVVWMVVMDNGWIAGSPEGAKYTDSFEQVSGWLFFINAGALFLSLLYRLSVAKGRFIETDTKQLEEFGDKLIKNYPFMRSWMLLASASTLMLSLYQFSSDGGNVALLADGTTGVGTNAQFKMFALVSLLFQMALFRRLMGPQRTEAAVKALVENEADKGGDAPANV